jgi:phospholipase A1
MKRYLAIAVLSMLAFSVCAQEGLSENALPGFTSYKPIYGVVGWGSKLELASNDLVMISFSMKYDPFSQWKAGLYLAYTQTMFWAFFDESNPFEKIDYNPEFFFRFESGYNFLGDVEIPLFDFIQLGWEHKSNGQAGASSRSWDRWYAHLQLGIGDQVHVWIGAKVFYYPGEFELFGIAFTDTCFDNPDIESFTSNFEFQIGLNFDIPVLPFKAVLSFGPGGGPWQFDFLSGWQRLDVYFLKFAGNLRPYLQIWHGFGQSITDYNVEDFNAHAGIAIEL